MPSLLFFSGPGTPRQYMIIVFICPSFTPRSRRGPTTPPVRLMHGIHHGARMDLPHQRNTKPAESGPRKEIMMHPAALAGAVAGRITHYALSGTAGCTGSAGSRQGRTQGEARGTQASGERHRGRHHDGATARGGCRGGPPESGRPAGGGQAAVGRGGAAALGGRRRGARPRPRALSAPLEGRW